MVEMEVTSLLILPGSAKGFANILWGFVGAAGTTQNTEPDYSVPGDGVTKLFNVFNGLGIM